MTNILIGLVIGVAGSLLATVLWVYLFDPIKFSISYGFTPVSGKYESIYPDYPEWAPESIQIRQIGFHISGELEDTETKEKYLISGKVASRIVTYLVRPKDGRLNEYSAGLIRLNQNGNGGKGYVVYLTEDKELPVPVRVVLRRSDNKTVVS
jgi:hypothetical protein